MQFQPKEEYQSSWDWTVAHSRWHFDNTRHDQPGEWFWMLGRMMGDWSKELESAEQLPMQSITWATRKNTPYYRRADGSFEQSSMLEQEEYDLESSGAGRDLELSDVVEHDDFAPVFDRMVNFWGIQDPWCRLHIQRPGQMFNLHIDKLWDRCPEDPEQVCRIMIFLKDWEPGQFFSYGTCVLSHWKAGDAMTFDWANVPHASANAGRSTRPVLMITGLKSDRTRSLLASGSPDQRYTV
jgi:hypothetical protein